MDSLISIIIPLYNHEQELWKALASIAAQTYQNVEVIIIDDGSDEEMKKLGNKEMKGVSVTLIRQDHGGAPKARNRGLKEANGEYVIFWDADVVGEPVMLEKMHGTLQDHAEASYAYCDFYFGRKKMPARPFDAVALRQMNYINTTSLIRRSGFRDNPWDESLKRFQDWDLWLSLLTQQKIGVYIPDCLFRITPRKGGMSHWLPSFAYRAPWRWLPGIKWKIREYEKARKVMLDKHSMGGWSS